MSIKSNKILISCKVKKGTVYLHNKTPHYCLTIIPKEAFKKQMCLLHYDYI